MSITEHCVYLKEHETKLLIQFKPKVLLKRIGAQVEMLNSKDSIVYGLQRRPLDSFLPSIVHIIRSLSSGQAMHLTGLQHLEKVVHSE